MKCTFVVLFMLALNVESDAMAIQFYEKIGITLKQRWESHYAMLDAGGLTIGLHPTQGETTGSGMASIGLFIDNIDEAKVTLEKSNTTYKEDNDKSGHYLNFNDLDGNLLYFVKPGW